MIRELPVRAIVGLGLLLAAFGVRSKVPVLVFWLIFALAFGLVALDIIGQARSARAKRRLLNDLAEVRKQGEDLLEELHVPLSPEQELERWEETKAVIAEMEDKLRGYSPELAHDFMSDVGLPARYADPQSLQPSGEPDWHDLSWRRVNRRLIRIQELAERVREHGI